MNLEYTSYQSKKYEDIADKMVHEAQNGEAFCLTNLLNTATSLISYVIYTILHIRIT